MNELTIELNQVKTKEELHSLLSSKLGFPDWYGNNWDAFWDMITDTDIVIMPNRLVVIGFKELSERLPKDAKIFRECFLELKQNYPSISCEVIYS
jgi:RNAse (barnase) inhibitor barstar